MDYKFINVLYPKLYIKLSDCIVVSGDAVLRAAVALEVVGGGQDTRPHDGPRRWRLHRDREEDKEEADPRLPLGEPEVPQLVGLQVLSVRVARSYKCYR